MRSLEGANCSDLPGFVVDKYFDCNVGREPLRAKVAKAICSNCAVQDDCRAEALTMAKLPDRGIIGGVHARALKDARAWLRFEHGLTDHPPRATRPEWLDLSDAAQTIEEFRTETDPDEPPPQI